MTFHEDDRAQRLLDVFDTINGQVNVSYVRSTDHVVAWHAHKMQTDYWVCLKGSFKVGLARGFHDYEFKYISDKNPTVLKISPNTFHGYRALEPNSILLYYTDKKYDPNDEIREAVGRFGEDWDIENK